MLWLGKGYNYFIFYHFPSSNLFNSTFTETRNCLHVRNTINSHWVQRTFSFSCWDTGRNGRHAGTATHVTFSKFTCDFLNFSASKKERCSKAYSKWRYYVLEKEWICHFDELWGEEQINRLLIVRRQLGVKNVQEMISVGLCWFNDIFKPQ